MISIGLIKHSLPQKATINLGSSCIYTISAASLFQPAGPGAPRCRSSVRWQSVGWSDEASVEFFDYFFLAFCQSLYL